MSQPLLAKGNDVFTLAVELPGFVSLAAQVALANMTRIALLTIDNAFLGHLGTTPLAAASLATVWIQVPLFSVWAMSSSLVTLCGQAYGAQNYKLMGIWLQMALVLVSILSLPVILWYWSIEIILSKASDDEEVVKLGVVFSRIMSLSVWPALTYACLRQYLQAMHIVAPTTIIGITSIGIAVLANYTLIYGVDTWQGFGFDGSPLATVIASWFQPIALFFYGFLYKKYHKRAWGGWCLAEHTQSRWRTFLTMALPLGLNDGLTFLANSCIALIVARLGVQILASNAIFLTLWVMLWALSFGVGCATQIKVATHLGAGHAIRARATSFLGFSVVITSTSVVITILWICKYAVLRIFTSDIYLIQHCIDVLPLYLCAYAFDALEITMTAILNGMGEMPFVSGVSLFGMWGVQLPLAYIFAIVYKLGLHGIWIGYTLTALFKLSVLSFKYFNINWNIAALKAMSAMEAIEAIEEETLQDEESLIRLHKDSSRFRLECAIPSPANAVLEGCQEGNWWHHKEIP
ncbi:Multidrug/Oligosaccharidyl-lipid/Polysaccharide (MOP) Flippase Superfamily [Thraustotheca clavata]|uniref:Multidrug/Oligosaccharidyl-lipid/Polysaccharide (MOP) Flippase Superfamily n=1 Tax=Thraustotheca clavata TaxID=74557 RepID=A0A1V9ZBV6_9STRA|nr:Multidrug/Oligosaccharidyl-lipid/Polysaccharide (MOP) Flippase Superfamily [Thraustotheca clavata]